MAKGKSQEAEQEQEAVNFGEGESMVVDFNNVEDVSFEVMPRGMYNVVVAECEFTYSQNSGNPMWTLQLEVEDGDFAGRKLFTHMVFAGNGIGFTKKQLGRIRPDLIENPFNPEDDEVIESMLGIHARARVNIRKYQGEDRNNVSDIFAAEDGGGF